jgi:hypothetical protein
MRSLKLGLVAVLIVATALALLWVTESVPRADVEQMAPKALLGIVVVVVAGVVLAALRGNSRADDTDKPVP